MNLSAFYDRFFIQILVEHQTTQPFKQQAFVAKQAFRTDIFFEVLATLWLSKCYRIDFFPKPITIEHRGRSIGKLCVK